MTKSQAEIVGKTDRGCVRERNEDSLALAPELGLLVVADGMGGHNSGEVASSIATETIMEFARRMLGGSKNVVPEGGDPGKSVRMRQLEHFIVSANTMIWEKSRAFPKDQGMGTTVVAALADENMIAVGHVGDSRLYLYRNGSLSQLTQDHSLVMDQVRRGLITPEQAEKSNFQNILTRALGTEEKVIVDLSEHPILPGDMFLLCSDGLTKMLSESDIAGVLGKSADGAEAVNELIEQSRARGGVDNITVAVLRTPREKGPLDGILKKIFKK